MNWFNYTGSDVLAFTLCVEDGERRSQSHSVEYYWLVPDPKITLMRYILIFLVVLITLTPVRPRSEVFTHAWVGITLSTFCVEVIISCICSAIQRATYKYHPLYFFFSSFLPCLFFHCGDISYRTRTASCIQITINLIGSACITDMYRDFFGPYINKLKNCLIIGLYSFKISIV